MKDNYPFDELERVKRIKAPPFLYTRIKARIQEQTKQVPFISIRWVYATGLAIVLLLLVNGFVISKRLNPNSERGYDPSAIVGFMELSSPNYLYDE